MRNHMAKKGGLSKIACKKAKSLRPSPTDIRPASGVRQTNCHPVVAGGDAMGSMGREDGWLNGRPLGGLPRGRGMVYGELPWEVRGACVLPGRGVQAERSFPCFAAGRRYTDLKFLLYGPDRELGDGRERAPVLVFLHAASESGLDLQRLGIQGVPKLLVAQNNEETHLPEWSVLPGEACRESIRSLRSKFAVICPQCRGEGRWGMVAPGGWGAPHMVEAVLSLISGVLEANAGRVDPSRIYVTGAGMGGAGCWELAEAALRYEKCPVRFAAVVPICGWVHPGDLADVELRRRRVARAMREGRCAAWLWHAQNDRCVHVGESDAMFQALEDEGAVARYTRMEWADARDPNWRMAGRGMAQDQHGHAAWVDAYERHGAALWAWLLSHRAEPSL